jgi:hypothetical protein
MGTKLDALTTKIVLAEFDIGQAQTLFFNWTAGVWYVDFDAIYALIDPAYLVGVYPQSSITIVGSVMENGVQLTSVGSVALCVSTDASFFYDLADRRLYIHLTSGAEPAIRTVILGITMGVSNRACNYNSMYYEPRLRSAPVIAKSKDPLYFGRISFDGGSFDLENADGAYDQLASASGALWGGAVRVLQGFDSDAYGAFLKMASGRIESVSISQMLATVNMIDGRKFLSRKAPRRVFSIGSYPNINYTNIGKPIPLAYGLLREVPCVCVNEEATAPATWDFKICDCTDHPIQSIDQIYSDGVKVTATTSSLANGTFSLAGGDFKSGTMVTADVHGYTAASVLINNPGDIILDLLNLYLGIPYTGVFFNTAEWAAASAEAMVVGIFVDEAREVFEIIEDICASTLLNMIQQDDGLLTLRIYDPSRAVSDTYAADQLQETPMVEYDATQVLTSTMIGYGRNWATGAFNRLHDISQEAAIFGVFKCYRERPFDTLLTNATDAQTFSTAILSVAGKVLTRVSARFKLEPVGREIMDFVMLPIYRQGKAMLGMQKCEVLSFSKDLMGASVTLGCRVV